MVLIVEVMASYYKLGIYLVSYFKDLKATNNTSCSIAIYTFPPSFETHGGFQNSCRKHVFVLVIVNNGMTLTLKMECLLKSWLAISLY